MTASFAPTNIVPLEQILPDEPLLMMGAGPVPIPPKVAAANSIVINHLGETMNRVIEQVKVMASYVFQTQSSHVMGVSGPGSAAMEMAIANLLAPGSKVLCITNGYFSQRLAEMARRVREVIAESEAKGLRDMGRVMATLKERHAADMDLSRASQLVRALLAGEA